MISVHIYSFVMIVCAKSVCRCETPTSEQLDFAGFTVFFINSMNYYPGVYVRRRDNVCLVTDLSQQGEKPAEALSKSSALYSVALLPSYLLSSLFPFLSLLRSPRRVNRSSLPPSFLSIYLTFYLAFHPSDHINAQTEKKLYHEWI